MGHAESIADIFLTVLGWGFIPFIVFQRFCSKPLSICKIISSREVVVDIAVAKSIIKDLSLINGHTHMLTYTYAHAPSVYTYTPSHAHIDTHIHILTYIYALS